MTSRHDVAFRLPGLLERGVPEPPLALDGASIRSACDARRDAVRRRAVPALAAAMVIAIAVPIALVGTHHVEQRRGVTTSPGIISGAAGVNAQRRHRAAVAVQRLAAAFSVPSAWRESFRALSADLRLPSDDPTTYSVQHGRLWVAAGNARTAMSYLVSHLPPGVSVGTPATNSTPAFASALLTPHRRWLQPALFGGVQISVVAQRLAGDEVGISVAVSAYWLPVRTPADTIPDSVTGATVVVTGSLSNRVRSSGRLDSQQARTLARAINALAVSHPAGGLCPVTGPTAAVTFAGPSGPRTATATPFCAAGVVVRSAVDGTPLYLAPGRIFDTVLAMLGLPADYGR